MWGKDVRSQNVILDTQFEVDNFYPGATYTGNITIGKPIGQGASTDITNLSNFSVLEVLNGNLIIHQNAELEDLIDLSNLTQIDGSLTIRNNDKLKNIDNFTKLEAISQIILIDENDVLTSINSLDNLDSIYRLNIQNNTSLKEIKGFKNLITVGSFLSLWGNDELFDISGLSKIESLGDLSIGYNHGLTNLDALSNLTFVDGYLIVRNNNNLTDCCGIQEILSKPYSIGDIIWITENPSECSSSVDIIDSYCGLRFNIIANPACINESNGSFQINVIHYEIPPFNYQWARQEDGETGSGSSLSPYFSIDMLPIGTYDISLTTTDPDTAVKFDIILPQESNESVFEITQIETTNSTNGTSNGSIEIQVSESNPPYEISWSGPSSGSQTDIMSDIISIPWLASGDYVISIINNAGNTREVAVTLLDETMPTVPCGKLDIVILNDVSGSVDNDEYAASKQFFVDLLAAINISLSPDGSRASIIEWSNFDQQEIKIPITGDISILNTYLDAIRSFGEQNAMPDAMMFGEEYLNSVARPDAERVLILATDASNGEVEQSIINLADQYKANGYHIVTIAFDNAFDNITVRNILIQMASVGGLAAGAPTYFDLDADFAENIVKIYICPTDPGETSNVYFNRDGSIDITGLTPIANCLNPSHAEVDFTIEALSELSIPGGTPVTFYLNNPYQSGATNLLTWQIPCSIAPDSSETYSVTVPISGPSHIYAVLNDDGSQTSPIHFPITSIEEIAYSNNIDDEWTCVNDIPTLQAIKYTSTPTPFCDTIVNYTINVCNISEVDANGVIVMDDPPSNFVLINSVLNLNECATEINGEYDIPAGCCISIHLTYDGSAADFGHYNDQDVLLGGPINQEYHDYDGASSTAEDVIWDGTIECSSTTIEFTKEVNLNESCDDSFLTFTFTINNELNFPLHGLVFSDTVPLPNSWVFEPYYISGLSIGAISIDQNVAQFTINEVDANSVASFSIDLSLGFWDDDAILSNSAMLANVPDFENGGTKTLMSNTTHNMDYINS